jgi:exonuclease III
MLHPSLPGTAVVWRKTLNVSEVNQLIERRAMSLKCGGEIFVNVYAPSGTANRKGRMEMFNELSVYLLEWRDKLPVMAGDWNVILAEIDTTKKFQTKFCKTLDGIVKSFHYHDCFCILYPTAHEFTFHRGEHVAQSRLDRVYIPPRLVASLVSARHKPGISDHCQVEVMMKLSAGQSRPNQPQKKSFWKLNT